MARDGRLDAAIALHRFGCGPRPGSIEAIASDARGALLAELDRPRAALIDDPRLPGSAAAARAAFEFQQARKAERNAAGMRREDADAETPAMSKAPAATPPQTARKPEAGPGVPQQLYLDEAKARLEAALSADLGFAERLAWFWSNHFCVSADKAAGVRALCGAYEREAIRPHVLGRFADMLLAVESHPAMLVYLDNARSIGPSSMAGIHQHKGLNENLARETLELHTLGARTVYSQDDVTRLAKVITGWSIVPIRQDPAHGGEFRFNPRLHEPGPQVVLGKSYADAGFDQGRAVLADLAKHPATASHVALKLARCFVADDPPAPLIDRLARRFLDTGGNLKEVARALVLAPEAWATARTKLKPPGQWIVAALRATGVPPPDLRPVIQAHAMLGAPLWRPPAPNGFSDLSADWMDGLSERLDVANQLSRRLAGFLDPAGVMDAALGPLASAETRHAITGAESSAQALTLLLMASEFQRS
jgi:uncharacterized protein (DUF1800 family)